MVYERVKKSSSWTPQPQAKSSTLASRPFPVPAKAPTPQEIDNQAFNENKHEALGLQLQAKYGSITPEGQERLTVLQAKMDAFRHNRLDSIPREGTSLLEIPNLCAPRETPQPIQPKLKIGKVGDKYEQEADRVAREVVQRLHMPVPPMEAEEAVQRQLKPSVVRMPNGVEKIESVGKEDATLMKKPNWQLSVAGGMEAPRDLEASIQSATGRGQKMSQQIREPMEQAFGADFSGVRVHTDSQSDQLNQSIQARAFTTGKDVFFRQGEYEPASREGKMLLAHELTHVVQQSGQRIARSPSNLIQCANTIIDNPSDHQNTVAPGSGRGLLQNSSGQVEPSVQFGPLRNGCGTYMHAIIHPTDDMGGTKPQPGTWPSWWDANKPTNTNFWVRGHLLNHNIGGPGDDKRNLTPITKKANKDHLKLVETAAKKASQEGWGLDYTVEAKYDTVGPRNLIGDNADPNPAVWPDLTTGFQCRAGFYHMKTGKIYSDQTEFIENRR